MTDGYHITIGPYRISSQDEFLSPNDRVGIDDISDLTHEEFREQLRLESEELAALWQAAVQGGWGLNDFRNALFRDHTSLKALTSKQLQCAADGNFYTETLLGFRDHDTEFKEFLIRGPHSTCADITAPFEPDRVFLERLGAAWVDPRWDGTYSNCHAYALDPLSGFGPGIVVNSYDVIPLRDGHLRIVTPMAHFLTRYYDLVDVIPSEAIPFMQRLPVRFDPHGDVVTSVTRIKAVIDDFDIQLNSRLQRKLDPKREYIMVFAQRKKLKLAGFKNEALVDLPHSGRLFFDRANQSWRMVSKVSIGTPVMETSVATTIAYFYINNARRNSRSDMFYFLLEATGTPMEDHDTESLLAATDKEPLQDVETHGTESLPPFQATFGH